MAQYFASGNGNIKYYRTFANRKYTDRFMKQIILITGGARSGKSSYAERLALSLSPNPVYLATSRIWDEEFRQRVLRHQANRGPEWTNIEEEKELSRHSLQGRVVLIDCVTLWCTNYFFDLEADTDKALAAIKTEFDRLTEQEAIFIFVTNEIGMGGTSENLIQRKFTDMQGWMNQYIATRANQVLLMVSGIPVKVKDEKQTID
ncbi:bifunctional adenosylcobinamide kinase/adenosylcobinamide-phosphate guanylyltransferase [Bacteroides fragilis]|uniref:bifunctional adenosylcobinamide kinase/adenosylcobinamide-phosphate guanylyltransferase n=1 Tax=Bacteroides fragilis TaxID=817 RepID=UPI00281222CB|nr:bifunctional adenosylcobinamide kinase/adenosylcobinamide-phosphate guanylyltransferase [Bacteroides fragilis]WMI95633.1 bifunctional adenosylcobinamide kinase/adenosylcobinamide-phosphate guanylyltransferase [Bacteroides fragilis]